MDLRSNAFTALLGAFAGIGVMLLTSQAFAPGASLRVQYVPSPRDYVQIQDGAPYTVPPGRILVLTAIGASQWSGGAVTMALNINGLPVVGGNTLVQTDHGSMIPLPTGLSAGPGSSVDVYALGSAGPGTIRAWGYLYQI